jgi:8-oxo-dGTP pyrophosphatase MutT (NUDIX family)
MKIIAKALLKNSDGKFLLLRRSKTHPNYPYHLDLPGGEVEMDEDTDTAVVREIVEETGLVVGRDNLRLVFDKIVGDERGVLYESTLTKDNSISLSWEHDQYIWLTLEELLSWQPSGSKRDLDEYYVAVIEQLSTPIAPF